MSGFGLAHLQPTRFRVCIDFGLVHFSGVHFFSQGIREESPGGFTDTGGALSVWEFKITRSILRFMARPSGVAFEATG